MTITLDSVESAQLISLLNVEEELGWWERLNEASLSPARFQNQGKDEWNSIGDKLRRMKSLREKILG